jgi:hypothetical protein
VLQQLTMPNFLCWLQVIEHDSRMAAAVANEVQLMLNCNHPNVVRAFDYISHVQQRSTAKPAAAAAAASNVPSRLGSGAEYTAAADGGVHSGSLGRQGQQQQQQRRSSGDVVPRTGSGTEQQQQRRPSGGRVSSLGAMQQLLAQEAQQQQQQQGSGSSGSAAAAAAAAEHALHRQQQQQREELLQLQDRQQEQQQQLEQLSSHQQQQQQRDPLPLDQQQQHQQQEQLPLDQQQQEVRLQSGLLGHDSPPALPQTTNSSSTAGANVAAVGFGPNELADEEQWENVKTWLIQVCAIICFSIDDIKIK